MLGQGGLGRPNLAAVPTAEQAPASGASPFNQTDWSKPIRPRRSATDLSVSLNTNLFKNAVPFNQADWAVARAIKGFEPSFDALNINLFTPFPFNQIDWAKPFFPGRAPQPAQPLNLNLYGVVSVPFNQFDAPRPYRPSPMTTAQQLFNPNIFTNPLPFSQFSFPMPRRVPVAPIDLSRTNPNLLFANPIPFAQYDWAKPALSRAVREQAQSYNINLYGSVAAPFNQYDWSPARKPSANQAKDAQNFILISVSPTAPPVVHDRPFFATVGRLMNTP